MVLNFILAAEIFLLIFNIINIIYFNLPVLIEPKPNGSL